MNQPTICPQCGGSFEAKTVTHQQTWGDELYEFENVPALVCAQCGEVWLSAEVAQLIESAIKSHPRLLYVFVAVEVELRRILHRNVTEHPTAEQTNRRRPAWEDDDKFETKTIAFPAP